MKNKTGFTVEAVNRAKFQALLKDAEMNEAQELGRRENHLSRFHDVILPLPFSLPLSILLYINKCRYLATIAVDRFKHSPAAELGHEIREAVHPLTPSCSTYAQP